MYSHGTWHALFLYLLPFQAQGLMSDISQLQRQLEMMETEYKLVDKTRVKALQVKNMSLMFKTTAVASLG